MRRYNREPDRAWSSNRVAGIDSALVLPLFDLHLPLSALYAGLTFRAPPALVSPEDAVSTPGI